MIVVHRFILYFNTARHENPQTKKDGSLLAKSVDVVPLR